ncbi:MAG: 50S ribosomal protein L20 [Candidatus Parcubacteria bacterium]|nr:MAG: 50S ribosomal protein L20 [Candidatus Parcubacteria bacterium]
MARVKRGTIKHKKREKILKLTKGFRGHYSKKKKFAKEALLHAFKHSYEDRKKKKRDFRRLWQIRINAAARTHNLTYSTLINRLKKNNIALNRKILSQLAKEHSSIFTRLLEYAK